MPEWMPPLPVETRTQRQRFFQQSFVESFTDHLDQTETVRKWISYTDKTIKIVGLSAGVVVGALTLGVGFVMAPLSFVAGESLNQQGKRDRNRRQARLDRWKVAYTQEAPGFVVGMVAHELAEVYEYQLQALQGNAEVQRLAQGAVARLFPYVVEQLSSPSELPLSERFSEALLLEGVLQGPSVKRREAFLETRFPDGRRWRLDSVWTKPGLRTREHGFKSQGGQASKPKKYGFRQPFSLACSLDAGFDHVVCPCEEDRTYEYGRFVVRAEEVVAYAVEHRLALTDPTRESNARGSLNAYLSARYGEGRLLRARCRDRFAPQTDLSQADLSESDWSGAVFNAVNLRQAQLRHSVGVRTQWVGSDLRDVDAKGMQLAGANLQRARVDGSDWCGADMRDAQLVDLQIEQGHRIYLYGVNAEGALWQGSERLQTAAIQTHQDLHDQVQRLAQALDQVKAAQEQGVTWYPVSNLSYYPLGADYYPRATAQEALTQKLSQKPLVLISGPRGSGKQWLARYYVHEVVCPQPEGQCHAWFFRAETPEQLSEDYACWARALGHAPGSEETPAAYVTRRLREQAANLVWVFLNATEATKAPIAAYIPSSLTLGVHQVIVTTADTALSLERSCQRYALEGFQTQEALDFLRTGVSAAREELTLLSTYFHRLPGGLALAKCYLQGY